VIKLRLLLENKETFVLNYLSRLLKGSPFENHVLLAGGAIRDQVMGKPVKDIDIVVTMQDGGITFAEWICKKTGAYKKDVNPLIFPRFGTAKFNLRGVKVDGLDLSDIDIEAVMTRGEKYTAGSRKPDVVYADLKTDAERRDLTINAMYKDLTTGKILDPTGLGMQDIKDHVIRTPLDPDITFEDDPLRMLRVIRFAVRYNWKIPTYIVDSLKKNAGMLKNISMERIQDEFNKMLLSDRPAEAVKLLTYTGLATYFLPEIIATIGVGQNQYHKDDVFSHTMEVLSNTPPDLVVRLSAIFHDIAKPAVKTEDETGIHFYKHEDVGAEMAANIMKRMKYSTEQIQSVVNIVANHMRLKSAGPNGDQVSDKALRKFAAHMGNDLDPAFKLMHADNISHAEGASMPNQIPAMADRIKNITMVIPAKPKLPVNGNDIMTAFNMKPGPEIKKILAALKLPGMKKMSASERLVVRVYTFFDSFFFKKPELKLWSKTFFCARVCLWFFNLQNHCMVLLYFVHHL
jgi:poly(A) polymerase